MNPKRTDDKYWLDTKNFNHFQYESDLEDYIIDLENNSKSKAIPELSDEEIIKGLCGKHYDPNNDVHYNLVEGAIWYREQVKRFISDKSGLT